MLGVKRQLRQIDERLQRLETLYIVRDPGNAVSADAYEGLRKRIAAAAKSRDHHLVDLAQLHRHAVTSDSFDVMLAKLEEAMAVVGLKRVESRSELPDGVAENEAFDLDGAGDHLVVTAPAYVEVAPSDDLQATGRVHIRGRATRRSSEPDEPKNAGSKERVAKGSTNAEDLPPHEAANAGVGQ